MLVIIALFIGSLIIFVWFVFLFPYLSFALLAFLPLIAGGVLLYWYSTSVTNPFNQINLVFSFLPSVVSNYLFVVAGGLWLMGFSSISD